MMKKAMIMPTVLVVTLLISLLVGTYMKIDAVNISKQFYIDLAEVRGYWGAYGAKELNSSVNYSYNFYDINITTSDNITYKWSLDSELNNSIYTRELTVFATDSNKTESYK